MKHWQECFFKIKCPYDRCRAKNLKTLENAKQHWLTKCPGIELTCQICDEKTTRMLNHNCEQNLKQLIQKLRVENKRLNSANLSKVTKQKYIVCPQGHPIVGYPPEARRHPLNSSDTCSNSGCHDRNLKDKIKYSCSHMCLWTLCENCYMCPSKHIFTIKYSKPGDNLVECHSCLTDISQF